MKTFRLLSYLLVMALSVSFVSCSSDDDDDNGGITSKLVKTIEYIDMDDDYTELCTFYYDARNRLTKYELDDDGYKSTISLTYETNAITIKTTGHDTGSEKLILDGNGYVTSYTTDWNGNKPITYKYENGYLKEDVYDGEVQRTYTWQNGNLVKADFNGNVATFEYNSVENKLNLELGFDDVEWVMSQLSFYRFKGMTNKNYLIKETEGDYHLTYDYTFDNEGNPTQIILTWSDGGKKKVLLTYY